MKKRKNNKDIEYLKVTIVILTMMLVLIFFIRTIYNSEVTKVYTPMPDYTCNGLKQIIDSGWQNTPNNIKVTEFGSLRGKEGASYTYSWSDYRDAYLQKC